MSRSRLLFASGSILGSPHLPQLVDAIEGSIRCLFSTTSLAGFVTNSGELFLCPVLHQFRATRHDRPPHFAKVQLAIESPIVSAAACGKLIYLISQDGSVLLLDASNLAILTPQPAPFTASVSIASIACSLDSSIMLSSTGSVFTLVDSKLVPQPEFLGWSKPEHRNLLNSVDSSINLLELCSQSPPSIQPLIGARIAAGDSHFAILLRRFPCHTLVRG